MLLRNVEKIKFFLFSLFTLFIFTSSVSAYTIPEAAIYINGYDMTLGDITIYLPYNENYYFSKYQENIINISNSNVTGYFTYNNQDYTVTFQPYQFGRYRLNNTSNYSYLDFAELKDYNLQLVDSNQISFLNKYKPIIVIIILLGVVALWIPSRKV